MKTLPVLAASFAVLLTQPSHAVNVTDGLIHLWHLDEPSGNTAADSIGSWDFTLLAGATLGVPGIDSTGVRLDGLDDFLQSSAQSGSFLASDFTVSLWLRWSGTAGKPGIYEFRSEGSYVAMDLNLELRPIFGSVWTGTSIADARWHLLSVVREGSAVAVYLDEAVIGTGRVGGVEPMLGLTTFKLGKHDATHFFGGTMDEVAIYDRALSAEEISANVVPEPGTGALLILAAGLLAVRRRKR